MSPSSLFWIVLYGISTLAFFTVAVAITVFGIRDLQSLLSKSKNRNDADDRDRP